MLPRSKNIWRSIALDKKAPIRTRLDALNNFQPTRYTLARLMRSDQHSRLRAETHASAKGERLLAAGVTANQQDKPNAQGMGFGDGLGDLVGY